MIPAGIRNTHRYGLMVWACLCGAILLGGCNPYSFNRGTPPPLPETNSFQGDLASEYQFLADFSAGQENGTQIAPVFYGKAGRAAAGEAIAPEVIESYNVPRFAVHDLVEARHALVDALARVNVPENAKMLAMAQVKFDCWLAYQPYQKKEGGYIGCREAFRQAMANVDMTRLSATPEKKSAPVGPQTIYFADDAMTLDQLSHDKIAALAEEALSREGAVIHLVGHSKTPATIENTSNNAVRRIIAVRNALYQNGVDPDLVEIHFESTGSPLEVDVEIQPGSV